MDLEARLLRCVLDVPRPVGAPNRLARRFIVHAVEHVAVLERVGEHLIHESLLVGQHDGIISLIGRREEERLFVATRVVCILPGKARCLIGIIDVVLRIVRAHLPVVPRVVEAIPDLDLHDDVALLGPRQQILKPLPVFVVPAIQVVLAVGLLGERLDFEALVEPGAHRVAHVVAAHAAQQVEVLLQIGNLEQIVVLAASDQHYRLAPILPITRIGLINVDTVGRPGPADRSGTGPQQSHNDGRCNT